MSASSASIGASLDQELAELRDYPQPHSILTHLATEIRGQFPGTPGLARAMLLAARTASGLIGDRVVPPDLVPAALSLLAGELDRMEREARS